MAERGTMHRRRTMEIDKQEKEILTRSFCDAVYVN